MKRSVFICSPLTLMPIFIFVGCASSSQATKKNPPPTAYQSSYRVIYGANAEHSPEAEKLKQEGWVVVGHIYGDGEQTVFAPPQH